MLIFKVNKLLQENSWAFIEAHEDLYKYLVCKNKRANTIGRSLNNTSVNVLTRSSSFSCYN